MRKSVTLVLLTFFGVATAAHAGDAGDRMLGVDMNRDKAEMRIDRLRDDKREVDKAHAEKPAPVIQRKKKKTEQNPN